MEGAGAEIDFLQPRNRQFLGPGRRGGGRRRPVAIGDATGVQPVAAAAPQQVVQVPTQQEAFTPGEHDELDGGDAGCLVDEAVQAGNGNGPVQGRRAGEAAVLARRGATVGGDQGQILGVIQVDGPGRG